MSQNQDNLVVKIVEIKRHTKAAFKEMWVTTAVVSIVKSIEAIRNLSEGNFTLSVFDRNVEYGSGRQLIQKPYPFKEDDVIIISKCKVEGINNFTIPGTVGNIGIGIGDFELQINEAPLSSYNAEEVAEVKSLQSEIANLQYQIATLQNTIQQKERSLNRINEEIDAKTTHLTNVNTALSQNYEEMQKIEDLQFSDYIEIAKELCKRGGLNFETTSKIYIDVKEMRKSNRKNSVLFKEGN